MTTVDEDRRISLIADFAKVRVLVLGDVMLDRFIYGRIERISPEAPVPILAAEEETAMPGGAANVARNIAALGGKALLVGAVGTDESGRTLTRLLAEQQGVEADEVVVPGRPTTVKIRYIAENQQVVRIDYEVRTSLGVAAKVLLEKFHRGLAEADIVILSDYAKGVLSDEVIGAAIAMAKAAGKPVVADPKSVKLARYDGVDLLTPNLGEAAQATKLSGREDGNVEAMTAAILADAPAVGAVIVTRGPAGMSLAERGRPVRHLPVTSREVADVSGAGDTVIATLALALAAGAGLAEAASLANVAAGIVVGKHGTADVGPDELTGVLQRETLRNIVTKTVGKREAADLVTGWRRQGLCIGFTNGCFDLIHPGHISLLSQAKRQCDRLVVGLNTDASVKRLKGPDRPIQNEAARAMVLGALAQVDLVVPFDEDTPQALIEKIRPNVLIKGADYALDEIVGADFVQSYGGKVVRAELTAGQSTTDIISRLKR